jgi:hypothetical protein
MSSTTSSSCTTTTTNTYPIFKGAIYNTAKANNTAFFGADLTPTNTPSIFTIYYVGNTTGGADGRYPQIRRINGGNTMLESHQLQFSSNIAAILQTIVGPSDSINFIFGTGFGSAYIVTLIVIETDINSSIGVAPPIQI